MIGSSERVVDVSGMQFRWSDRASFALELETLYMDRGERVFVEGASGSGKSTLLSLLTGIVVPVSGSVKVLGHPLENMGRAQRDLFRADHIGYIFQMFNLIPYLSVVENVTLPCRFSKTRLENTLRRSKSPKEEALRLLHHLGLDPADLLDRQVAALSVGQQQRVAAARALIGSPEIVLADEPTSALDTANRKAFVELLFKECSDEGSTLIFVSHDTSLAPLFDRTVRLDVNGKERA